MRVRPWRSVVAVAERPVVARSDLSPSTPQGGGLRHGGSTAQRPGHGGTGGEDAGEFRCRSTWSGSDLTGDQTGTGDEVFCGCDFAKD